jgi:hypothetical protein
MGFDKVPFDNLRQITMHVVNLHVTLQGRWLFAYFLKTIKLKTNVAIC